MSLWDKPKAAPTAPGAPTASGAPAAPAAPPTATMPRFVPPPTTPLPTPTPAALPEPAFLLPTHDDLWSAYQWLDAQLVSLGWHASSPLWLDIIERFMRSSKKRLVVQMGRRGGKTVHICRIVATIVLFGKYSIPQGDVGYFPILSVKLKDAKKKLAILRKILTALKVNFKATKEELILTDYPVIIESRAASANTVVGDTCIGLMLEEVSRWRDKDSNANPAKGILSSIRPNMATQPEAMEFMISSPWSTEDAHYQAVEEGDTDAQMVVKGVASWVANPTVTEAWCRNAEPIDLFFNREYASIPMPAGTEAFYTPYDVDQAMRPAVEPDKWPCVGSLDLAFDSDWYAMGVARVLNEEYYVTVIQDYPPPTEGTRRFSEVLDQCVPTFKRYGIVGIMADRHYKRAVEERLAEHGMFINYAPMDSSEPHIRLKTLMKEGKVHLPQSRRLREHLLSVMSTPVSGGKIRIVLPKRTKDGHCDDVAALVLLTWQRYALDAEDAPAVEAPRRPAVQEELDRRAAKKSSWLSVKFTESRDAWRV